MFQLVSDYHHRVVRNVEWREWVPDWRCAYTGRPLLAGLLTLAGGLAIMFLPAGRYSVLLLPGMAGTTGFLLGGLLCLCGLFLIFSPGMHAFIGVTAALLALTALVTTNIGGFLVGTLLGLVGGSLGFAWTSPRSAPHRARHGRHG